MQSSLVDGQVSNDQKNSKALPLLKKISPVAWQNIHFHGRYTFCGSRHPINLDAMVANLTLEEGWTRATSIVDSIRLPNVMENCLTEISAVWAYNPDMATDAPALQPESGLFMPRFLRLMRRFPLPEPTILNPYRTVIQELTKGRHESRGSPDVKLYLFAGIGKKTQPPLDCRSWLSQTGISLASRRKNRPQGCRKMRLTRR